MGGGLGIGVTHEGLYIDGGRARFSQAVSKRGSQGVCGHALMESRTLDGRGNGPLEIRFIHVM